MNQQVFVPDAVRAQWRWPCDECHAQRGEACVGRQGLMSTWAHRSRYRKWLAAGAPGSPRRVRIWPSPTTVQA